MRQERRKYGTEVQAPQECNLGLQQSWCRIVLLPLSDHSTANVNRAFATLRDRTEIPVAAKTTTTNSCSERNFCPVRTVNSVQQIGKAGIPLRSIGFVLLASLCLVTPAGHSAEPQNASGVPPAIRSANKLFISNAGANSGLFPKPFSGTADRAYTQFFSAFKAASHYELVADPSDADLVLELQLIAPAGPANADKQKGASDPLPEFRLTIYDRRSHYILWTLAESIGVANFQKTHDRNFDQALTQLLDDFQQLAGRAPASGSSPRH
jgi:hypothetical protein